MSAIFSLLTQVLDHVLLSFMSPMLFFPILFFFFFLPSVSVWIISIFALSNLPLKVNVLVTQYYSALCDPMDCVLPHSSVCGILQARTLEEVALPFSLTQGLYQGLLHFRQTLT